MWIMTENLQVQEVLQFCSLPHLCQATLSLGIYRKVLNSLDPVWIHLLYLGGSQRQCIQDYSMDCSLWCGKLMLDFASSQFLYPGWTWKYHCWIAKSFHRTPRLAMDFSSYQWARTCRTVASGAGRVCSRSSFVCWLVVVTFGFKLFYIKLYINGFNWIYRPFFA